MRRADDMKASGGFSLLEILIVLAVLTILVTMAVSTFRGLDEKYKVETETKQLYTDLMEARGRAAQRYRVHFVRLAGNGYATYEDTDPAPDGNGILDIAADTGVARANVRHAIIADPAGLAAFEFDRNGIASALGNIRFVSTAAPDYDCITILPTRVKMGQYSGGTCVEK